jgi:hypothetical protein
MADFVIEAPCPFERFSAILGRDRHAPETKKKVSVDGSIIKQL